MHPVHAIKQVARLPIAQSRSIVKPYVIHPLEHTVDPSAAVKGQGKNEERLICTFPSKGHWLLIVQFPAKLF